jgi:hypothetical protein
VDEDSRARGFVRRFKWPWPQLPDRNRGIAKRFRVPWQPAVILVDARGRIAGFDQSYGREKGWNRLVARLP